MATENIKRALKIILERNQNARFVSQQHYNKILDEIPRVREIYKQMAQTGLKVSNIVFSNDTSQKDIVDIIENIKVENLNLQKELKLLLHQNGYESDYLDTNYTCSDCEDTGFINGYRCKCLRMLITDIAVSEFNSSSNLAPLSFNTFSLKYYSNEPDSRGISPQKTMENIMGFCKQYADKFSKTAPSVLMIGETGLGKTHLSISIANAVIKRGFNAIYSSSLDLFRILQNEYFGRSDGDKNTIQTILDADLVIIDDLGAEFDSAFNSSCLYNIVNSRLNANKPTIINTNLVPSEIEKRYTTRIASRLMTLYKCLKFTGRDVRQIKLTNNEI